MLLHVSVDFAQSLAVLIAHIGVWMGSESRIPFPGNLNVSRGTVWTSTEDKCRFVVGYGWTITVNIPGGPSIIEYDRDRRILGKTLSQSLHLRELLQAIGGGGDIGIGSTRMLACVRTWWYL